MTIISKAVRVSIASLLLVGAASAATVTELETNGTSANNTIGTAQTIAASAFTSPSPSTVFNAVNYQTATIQGLGGGNDVDFFRFSSPGGTVMLDMDNSPASFDPIVALFNAQGTLLAYGDDSPVDPGSANSVDSFVGVFRLPSAGDYYLAVSENPNFPTAALIGPESSLMRPDGLMGGYAVTAAPVGESSFDFNGAQVNGSAYTLQVSVNPVPEPGSVMLMSVGCAGIMGVWLRRRRANR